MSNAFFVTVEKPNTLELRKFGLVSAAMVTTLFALVFPWLFNYAIPQWPLVTSAILFVWSIVLPASLIFIYIPWMKLGGALGYVNTRIILTAVFYALITPMGFLARLFGASTIKNQGETASS